MPISANSYGSADGVAALVKHIAASFTTTTAPTLAQVEAFLDQRSAILNGWLKREGYGIPVTQSDAVQVLSHFANYGGAADAEMTQRPSGYSVDDQNRRENKFEAEFWRAEAYIASGALAALGVPTAGAPGPLMGLSVGGVTKSGQRLRPIFKRRSLGNQPDAESPAGRETTYTGDP